MPAEWCSRLHCRVQRPAPRSHDHEDDSPPTVELLQADIARLRVQIGALVDMPDAYTALRTLLLAASQQVVVGNQVRPPVDLAEALLDEHPEQTAPWAHNAILASELLVEVGRERFGRLGARRAALWERTVRALVIVLEHLDPQGQTLIPLAERVRAGQALATLGDPRFPTTVELWRAEPFEPAFGAPSGYWCYVPGRTYTIGGWNEGQPSADIPLQPFWIARFPITVAQYRDFVAVGYGADAERWWPPQGWRWKQDRVQPSLWEDLDYTQPNQPVIAITWYEALAFTNWLREMLRDDMPAGYILRMPTEAEWEVAAAYDQHGTRRTYPWGEEEPTPERAIYDASGLDVPAPVGCCPVGAAPCGALDLAGNVWEWVASRHQDYPAGSNKSAEDFTPNDRYVPLRGGAHYFSSTDVRCGARIRYPPVDGLNCGFRVVVSPRLAHMS